MSSPLPLEGIKVVEIAQALAGPFAGEILAHMGADVVKVERPEGDEARGWGPPFTLGGGPTFHAVNMNKRSIVLDLKDPEAIAWLKGYLAQADVLVQNLRPGVIEELGLGAEALHKINPRLIFCSLWAFGHTGPRRLRPGYEPMVQAFAGLFSVNGGEEDPPSRFGAPVLDLGTGMWAAMGVLVALHRRARTGRGGIVDASLFETALGWLTGHVAGYQFTGDLPSRERTGSRRLVPFQGFQTKNGTVIIAAGNDRLFAKLATALGHPEWAKDPRFATNGDRRPRGGRRSLRPHSGPARDAGRAADRSARRAPKRARAGIRSHDVARILRRSPAARPPTSAHARRAYEGHYWPFGSRLVVPLFFARL